MTRHQIEIAAVSTYRKHLRTGCRIALPQARYERQLVALGYDDAEARLILIDCWDMAELEERVAA